MGNKTISSISAEIAEANLRVAQLTLELKEARQLQAEDNIKIVIDEISKINKVEAFSIIRQDFYGRPTELHGEFYSPNAVNILLDSCRVYEFDNDKFEYYISHMYDCDGRIRKDKEFTITKIDKSHFNISDIRKLFTDDKFTESYKSWINLSIENNDRKNTELKKCLNE